MVCKEQLCDWFRLLSPYKRIDYMCALMQLLLPLELRFLGSVLEDLCKKDFLFLRDAETKANNIAHLEHITNLSEILVSLPLLHSTRSRCSYALFNVIHAYLQRCFNQILANGTETEKFKDLMTMLTLTVNHPAFSYEQKQSIYEFYSRACDYSRDKKTDKEDVTFHLPDGYEFSLDTNTITHQQHMAQEAFITGLEVKENSKRHHDSRLEIKVTWSDDRVEYVYKTTKELSEFHNKLCKLFPSTGDENIKIPVLKTRDEKHAISMYIRKLGKLPKHILGNVHVVEFFKGDNSPKSSYCASTSPSNLSIEDEETTFPMKTLTYVNSQNIGHEFNRLQDVAIPHRQLAGQTLLTRRIDSPSQSPHSSSTESPQNSPVASPSSQQSELMQLLVSEHSDILNKYGFDQILLMKDDDLVKADLSKEALKKLRVKINEHLSCEKPNGMKDPVFPILAMYPRFPPPQPQISHPPPPFCHFNPPFRPPTRDSSPCNSEPSSPPASPHLQQHLNLVKPLATQGPEDKATREEKDFAQAASIPRTGGGKVSQGSVKYPPHANKPPEGLLPQLPLTHDLQGLSNQNGFQSDNPQGIVRPDIRSYQQFAGKYAVYPPKLWMMQTDKAPPYAYAPIPATGFSNMMDSQVRPYMNQPGILGQPPNAVSSRPGFTSVSNSTTITCPRTSLTPTPPMPGNPGTKSPNTVSTIVNSSSDPNLQSNEPSTSPSPLQMNAPPPANTSVPCSVGPVAHNNQPCSACGSRPQPSWSIQGLNGFIPPIPSMHPYHPQIHQQTFANGTHSELIFSQMPQHMFYNAPQFFNMTYGNNLFQSVPGNGVPKKMSCYNCGDNSHKPSECKERTMENIDGHFKLQFKTKSDSD